MHTLKALIVGAVPRVTTAELAWMTRRMPEGTVIMKPSIHPNGKSGRCRKCARARCYLLDDISAKWAIRVADLAGIVRLSTSYCPWALTTKSAYLALPILEIRFQSFPSN
jgi:hypothetical protein